MGLPVYPKLTNKTGTWRTSHIVKPRRQGRNSSRDTACLAPSRRTSDVLNEGPAAGQTIEAKTVV